MAAAEIDMRDLYRRGLSRLHLGPVATGLLEKTISGDDKGVNFEEILRSDAYFTTHILRTGMAALKKGEVRDLSHAAVLLGQDLIRNFVLGHTIRRASDATADQSFEDLGQSVELLKRTAAAQELAVKNKYEHPGLAAACGFVFDVLEHGLRRDPALEEKYGTFCDQLWSHSAKTAVIAWALGNHPKVRVRLKKHLFSGGLVHDCGKLLMASLYPADYLPVVAKIAAARELSLHDDGPEASLEREVFGLSHTEVGSLALFATGFLRDEEAIVDFHHDTSVLKARDGDLFLASVLLNISDRLAFLLETRPNLELDDIGKILTPHKQNFPLSSEEIQSLLAALRSKGSLS